MVKRDEKQDVIYAVKSEQKNREDTAQKFVNAQKGYHNWHNSIDSMSPKVRGVFETIIDIVGLMPLRPVRPEPGSQKKRKFDDESNENEIVKIPENKPDLSFDQEVEELDKNPQIRPKLEELIEKMQSLSPHELTELQKAILATEGECIPGAVLKVVLAYNGSGWGISYDNMGAADLASMNGHVSNVARKNYEERSFEEGGVSAEVAEADEEEGLFTRPADPLKAKPTPL